MVQLVLGVEEHAGNTYIDNCDYTGPGLDSWGIGPGVPIGGFEPSDPPVVGALVDIAFGLTQPRGHVGLWGCAAVGQQIDNVEEFSWMPWNWHMLPAAPSPTPEQKTRFDQLEGQQNIPAGTLNAVMQAESHGDPNATSPVGAKGQFQFMDATARTYDVQDPRDFTQSSAGAARYLHKLLQEFHGDLAKAAA